MAPELRASRAAVFDARRGRAQDLDAELWTSRTGAVPGRRWAGRCGGLPALTLRQALDPFVERDLCCPARAVAPLSIDPA